MTEFRKWLEQQGQAEKSIAGRVAEAKRVRDHYGDLDELYDEDRLRSVIDTLQYSREDERRKRPNPSRIPIQGDLRANLATYKAAVTKYREFRRATQDRENVRGLDGPPGEAADESADEHGQLVGLERDLQVALRRSIEQLEPGLEITDDGAERKVASGFVDITARDAEGVNVVIELKSGTARREAVAQILSYMGDIADEEPDRRVRGILVAGDFDERTRAAARMVPALSLRSYRVSFEFRSVDAADAAPA